MILQPLKIFLPLHCRSNVLDYSAGIKFRLQNLMSQIVSRALRVKPGGNFMAVDSLGFTLNINQNYIILFIVIQISYIGLYV